MRMTWFTFTLFVVVVAAIAPQAASQEVYTLRATCDNVMTVFVDGVQQAAEGLENWPAESQISVPSNFKVIGIQCLDYGVIPGILASLHDENGDEVLVTDKSWTCSQKQEEGWTAPGFDSGTWEEGDVIGQHGVAPWRIIGQISRNAGWIWTKDHKTHTTVYCRYEPVVSYTLRATCDNVMTIFVDGVQQAAEGLDNWTVESQISVPSNFKEIGIQCLDYGVVPGILASLHDENGDELLVTDESWTCTQLKGWCSTAWEKGDVIGKHGVAPWRFIGQISRGASWIWTEGHQTYTTVYCRYGKV